MKSAGHSTQWTLFISLLKFVFQMIILLTVVDAMMQTHTVWKGKVIGFVS